MRGRAFAFANIIQFSAIPLVALLGWLLVPRTLFGLDGWRFVVMAGSAGAVLVWFVRARLPESPRWLASHGRAAEAEAIVEAWEVEAQAGRGRCWPSREPHAGRAEARLFRRNLAAALSAAAP